jgi:hypothetical protein
MIGNQCVCIAAEVCLLPVLGISLMIVGKVAPGNWACRAERLFLGTLMLAGLATFRTLLAGETIWLMHAVTLAILIVGSVSVPCSRAHCGTTVPLIRRGL